MKKIDHPGDILKALVIDFKIRITNDTLRGRDINSPMPEPDIVKAYRASRFGFAHPFKIA